MNEFCAFMIALICIWLLSLCVFLYSTVSRTGTKSIICDNKREKSSVTLQGARLLSPK